MDRARASGRGPLLVLEAVVALALTAPWFAPHSPVAQFDPAAGADLPPLSERWLLERRIGGPWVAEEVACDPLECAFERGGRPGRLASRDLTAPPRRIRFWLGTDRLGRDVLSRLLHGARSTVAIALAAALVALVVGASVGGLAALRGGWTDLLAMRLADGLAAIPRAFLLLGIAALTRPGAARLAIVIGLTSWVTPARLARSRLLAERDSDHMAAARGLGAGPLRLLTRHLLPAARRPLLVDAAHRVGDVILLESALSFLGAGIQPPRPSWGGMIADAGVAASGQVGAWLAPGLAVCLLVLLTTHAADTLQAIGTGDGTLRRSRRGP